MLKVGTIAPELSLAIAKESGRTLKAMRGKKVVLYFYPKDMTPGCTQEACDFRDNMSRLSGRGVVVLGVSSDTAASHTKFREKYDLNFELLSDPEFTMAKTYRAYGEKTLYGQKVTGTVRSTYLIDEKGKIAAVWSPVKVDGHVTEVLTAIRELDVSGSLPRARPRTEATGRKPNSKPRLVRSRRAPAAHPAH